MKSLTFLLLLLPAFCFSQKKDTLTILSGANNGWGNLVTSNSIFHTDGGSWQPNKDSIPVLLLVCDTMYGYYTELTATVWWQLGYKVESNRGGTGTLWLDSNGVLVDHTKYLDQNKKPLAKNIIVWMSKEIKNQN